VRPRRLNISPGTANTAAVRDFAPHAHGAFRARRGCASTGTAATRPRARWVSWPRIKSSA